jgi:hypothetical protein
VKTTKKQTKPNSYTPWNCVILAVDPGQKSGVAIYRAGELVKSGTNHDKPLPYWCRIAALETTGPDYDEIPLIVVIESHVVHGRWSAKAMAGTAESTGVWKEYVSRLEGLKWKPKVLRLPVDEWRSGVFGKCRTPVWAAQGAEGKRDLIGRYATRWWKVGDCAGVKAI